MIIDSHNHVCFQGLDTEAVIGELDAFGIRTAWLLTWYHPPLENAPSEIRAWTPTNLRPDGTHAGQTLREILDARDRYPDRFVAGYCPCPAEGDAAALLETACHMHGVRVCGEWSYRMLLDDSRTILLFQKAGELGMPVVLHIDAPFIPTENGARSYEKSWYGGGLGALERALQACPDTVIIGHAPGFWRYLSGDEDTETARYPRGPIVEGGELYRLLDTYPNLWADLSAGSALWALQRNDAHAVAFIERYADRLLFGRDAIGDELRQYLLSLDLPADVADRIFFRNALRLVPIDGIDPQ